MNKSSKIYIAGHLGMVGSAILRKLQSKGFSNLIFRTSTQLDWMPKYDLPALVKKMKECDLKLA